MRDLSVVTTFPILPENLLRPNLPSHFLISFSQERYLLEKRLSHVAPNVLVYLQLPTELPLQLQAIAKYYQTQPQVKYQLLLLAVLSMSINHTNSISTVEETESFIRNVLINNSNCSGDDDFSNVIDLNTSVYVGFPLTENSFTIWEFYWVKRLLVLQQVSNNVSDLYDWIVEYEIQGDLTVRRQAWGAWGGVTITAGFVIDSRFNTTTDEVSIRNITVNSTTSVIQLVSGLSTRLYWDFATALNFTENVAVFHSTSHLPDFNTSSPSNFDIFISHFGVNPERVAAARCLHPTSFEALKVFFVQPARHISRNSYTDPFTKSTWWAVFATGLVIPFLIYWSMGYLEKSVQQQRTQCFSKDDVFFWAAAAACQRSWPISTLPFVSLQLFLFTTLAFYLLWYNFYGALLLTELRANRFPIRSLDELMKYVDTIYLSREIGASATLQQSIEKRSPELAHKLNMNSSNRVWILTERSDGKECFVAWPSTLMAVFKNILEGGVLSRRNDDTDFISFIMKIRQQFKTPDALLCKRFSSFQMEPFALRLSMFVHKRSPFAQTFNYRITIGRERGLVYRYWKIYDRNSAPVCLIPERGRSAGMIEITFMDTGFVFWVLSLGQIACIIVLLVEKWQHRKKKKKVIPQRVHLTYFS